MHSLITPLPCALSRALLPPATYEYILAPSSVTLPCSQVPSKLRCEHIGRLRSRGSGYC
jgi:hypothetical protein